MDKCFEIELLKNNNPGIFENAVDLCVVLTCCEHNNYYRMQDVIQKLKTHHLHSKTFIIKDKGLKSCDKKDNRVKQVKDDIYNSYYYIFKKFSNLNRILFLEDDFQFDDRVYNHSKAITEFITRNDFDCYSLGSMGIFNLFSKHQRSFYMGSAHAVIYSKNFMHRYIDFYETTDKFEYQIDIIWNFFKNVKNYRYYLPICYQTFPETESNKYWGNVNIGAKNTYAFFKTIKST